MSHVKPPQPLPLRPVVAPSILACDFAELRAECASVLSAENGAAEWLHVDVMDGHFVPNISIGAPVVTSLRHHFPDAFLDCHLMVSEPARWLSDFAKAGASLYTFHIEAVADVEAAAVLARAIRAAGMFAGVSVKPATPVASIFPLCDAGLIDLALVMTVEPGFGGQSFMRDMMPKVAALRERYPLLTVEVDGGLNAELSKVAAAAGANAVVAGTSVFKARSRRDEITGIRAALEQGKPKP